jgi:CO/xanthine dehydrogenase FAD-binding subunit
MADQLNLVFFPASYSELFNAWNRYPKAVPYAGGTALIREQGKQILELPPIIISLEKLQEMQKINRSERYLEIGSMVKLSQIIDMGKIVPAALRRCLEHIAGPQLRNMATIGGNLCYRRGYLDSSAVLMALDAQYELRSAQSARWISASRFSAEPTLALKDQELLTRIRVPLDDWNYTVYTKFSGQAIKSKTAVFLAKTQKNVLNDIRVIYKTDALLRDKPGESLLVGKHLPLNHRIAADFIDRWSAFISGTPQVDELSRNELVNFIETNISNLSE